MSAIVRKQDLPPPGGYPKIAWQKNPARKIFNAPLLIATYLGVSVAGYYLVHLAKRDRRRELCEAQSGNNAVMPFLFAERDRLFLKQIRKNRDAEEELMKNVPGWEVGTYYGKKVFTTVKEDQWVNPSLSEFYAHAPRDAIVERRDYHLWN